MVLSAVIFDLNGTILEDEDVYGKAFNVVLKSLGVDTKMEIPHEKGIGVRENWQKFIVKYGIKTDKSADVLTKETQDAYLDRINEVNVRPGFDDLIDRLKESEVSIALATSNTWEQTDKILDITNLHGIFNVVTTCDEVTYNKPDPDIFLVALDKLGVDREHCLVVEDSVSGIEAATRAGIKVIGITSDENEATLSRANMIIEGFSEITREVVDQL